ncbi:rifin [Plasmodium falciparum 3D7]|uniref:Rifin n=1 Tax=Plasmodium falciparum (isolate 3D7) TaxID=36329 RepID=A0A143ZXG5_PLAF7|nr:rifin [Plasmodium falciparum 3D7]CZT98661.1 rifin [Plasmodium falciparum 3D7]|eukprot:XP_001347683.2 rifin [Plasmodium falciparum 3D7]
MKLHFPKILLFFFPSNILLTSYHVHSKNKPHTTPHHTPTTTSRVLSECDTQSTNYNNDEDIKSVKEIFDRQTSQRFEEYEERMQEKRQKRKEKCDKNIQKIIQKDKREKSLEEKVEKCCLICGCGLGGVAASVGIFGTIAVNEWTKAAIEIAKGIGMNKATSAGVAKGIEATIDGLKGMLGFGNLRGVDIPAMVTEKSFNDANLLVPSIQKAYYNSCSQIPTGSAKPPFCGAVETNMQIVFSSAHSIAMESGELATKTTATLSPQFISDEITLAKTASTNLYNVITYSVIVIILIVLVMLIIYLVLRYRRKKKMNKKQQYTKLLNQ